MRKMLLSILCVGMMSVAFAHGGGGGGRGTIEEGLAVGVETGFQSSERRWPSEVTRPNGDIWNPDPQARKRGYIRPYIGYANRFWDNRLFLRAEMDVTTNFAEREHDGNDSISPRSGWNPDEHVAEHELYLNLELELNRDLGNDATLSFLLQKEFDHIDLSMDTEDGEFRRATAMISPGGRLGRTFPNGDSIFTEVRMPITYSLAGTERVLNKARSLYQLEYAIGWEASFGTYVEVRAINTFAPRGGLDNNTATTQQGGLTNVELTLEQEIGRVTAGLDFDFRRGLNPVGMHRGQNSNEIGSVAQTGGIDITPRVSVNIWHLDIYAEWTIGHAQKGFAARQPEHALAFGVRWTIFD